MRISARLDRAIGATAALAVLAMLSASAGDAHTPSHRMGGSHISGFVSVEAGAPGGASIFVSDRSDSAIFVYDARGRQTAVLSGHGLQNPEGIATTPDGALYVANAGRKNILVYRRPFSGAPAVLSNGGVQPDDIAIDRNGDVAAAAFESISFFARGATSPTKILQNTVFSRGIFNCAFDRSGNLFVTGNGYGGGTNGDPVMAEVVGGAHGTALTPLSVGNIYREIGGVQAMNDGSLAVIDQGFGQGPPTIFTYAPPVDGALGSPKVVTALQGYGFATFKFLPGNRTLFAAGALTALLQGAASYGYPKGGAALESLVQPFGNGADVYGIALFPLQSP
jgi:hypothetical protein